MATSRDYWRRREQENLKKNLKSEAEYAKELNRIYSDAMDNIKKEIDAFYGRYAGKEGITIAEAKKRVSKLDIEAYSRKAEKYVREKDFSKQANEEMRLYNLTMKVNRLEMLKAQIGLELVSSFDEMQKFFEQKLTDRTIEEFQRQAGILGESVGDVTLAASSIVGASFHNATFSQRIWANQDLLRSETSKLLQTGMIQGRHPDVLARELRKRIDVSRFNSERLMRTEMARVQTEAQMQSFERYGFEEYEYMACHYGDVCTACKALDGKHFKTKDAMPGENAPPMHPFCHCSTCAWLDEEKYNQWLDSYSDHRLSFREWQEMQTDSGNHDIMNMYLKNIRKKQGKEGVAVLNSYTALPKKLRKAFEKVRFDFGYNASACDIKNRTVRVGKNATKEQIDHEFGHLVEHEILSAADVKAYKEYLVEGLGKNDISPMVFYDNTGNEVSALVVRGKRFVSEYQGYLYFDDINDIIRSDGTINIDCLGEVIAEPFRIYCNDKKALTDDMARALMERAVK